MFRLPSTKLKNRPERAVSAYQKIPENMVKCSNAKISQRFVTPENFVFSHGVANGSITQASLTEVANFIENFISKFFTSEFM
jgi:hypothetical protein